MADHNELGKIGEQLAADYLSRNGFEILERNYYYDKAEIDIIAQNESNPKPVIDSAARIYFV